MADSGYRDTPELPVDNTEGVDAPGVTAAGDLTEDDELRQQEHVPGEVVDDESDSKEDEKKSEDDEATKKEIDDDQLKEQKKITLTVEEYQKKIDELERELEILKKALEEEKKKNKSSHADVDQEEFQKMKDELETTKNELETTKKTLEAETNKREHLQVALDQVIVNPETREDRFNDSGYVNWITCTMSMVKAKDAIGPTTETMIKKEVESKISIFESDCSHTHTVKPSDKFPDGVQLPKSCIDCKNLYIYLQSLNREDPKDATKKKGMNSTHCQYQSLKEESWNLAKPYMPEKQRTSKGHSDIDPAAMFKLLERCTLFDVQLNVVERLLDRRNEMMHSCDNKVNTVDADQCLQALKALLTQKPWKNEEGCKQLVEHLEKLLVGVTDGTDLATAEKAALDEKSKSVSADKEEAENKGEDTSMYNALLAVTNTIKKNSKIETLSENIKKKDETIKEVTTQKESLVEKVDVLKEEKTKLVEKTEQLEDRCKEIVAEKEKEKDEQIQKIQEEKQSIEEEYNQLTAKLEADSEQHQKEMKEKEQEISKLLKEKDRLSEKVPEPESTEASVDPTTEDIVARQLLVENLMTQEATVDYVKLFFESLRHIQPQVRVEEAEKIGIGAYKVTLEHQRYVDIILDIHKAETLKIAGSAAKITALRDDTGGQMLAKFEGYDAQEAEMGDGSPSRKIAKVESLENANVFSKYHRHKQRLSHVKNAERTMWYCVTKQQDIDDIKANGFSLKFPGRHESNSGDGVYFVERLPELYKYWQDCTPDETTWVIQAKVLTGRWCQGDETMTSLPDDYQSAVNDIETPTEFVIFDMELAYPEFLVTFKCPG